MLKSDPFKSDPSKNDPSKSDLSKSNQSKSDLFCISVSIRNGWENQCFPYAGFFQNKCTNIILGFASQVIKFRFWGPRLIWSEALQSPHNWDYRVAGVQFHWSLHLGLVADYKEVQQIRDKSVRFLCCQGAEEGEAHCMNSDMNNT